MMATIPELTYSSSGEDDDDDDDSGICFREADEKNYFGGAAGDSWRHSVSSLFSSVSLSTNEDNDGDGLVAMANLPLTLLLGGLWPSLFGMCLCAPTSSSSSSSSLVEKQKTTTWHHVIQKAKRDVMNDAASIRIIGTNNNNNKDLLLGDAIPKSVATTYSIGPPTTTTTGSTTTTDHPNSIIMYEGTMEFGDAMTAMSSDSSTESTSSSCGCRSISGNGHIANDNDTPIFQIEQGLLSPSGKCYWVEQVPGSQRQYLVTGAFVPGRYGEVTFQGEWKPGWPTKHC